MCEHDIVILCEQDRKDDLKKGSKKENGKTTRFTIRLNREEHQEFIKKAEMRNMNIAEYIRYLVKNDKIK